MGNSNTIKFFEQDVTIVGSDLEVGQAAPEFSVHNANWSSIKVLESTKGKVRIIGSLPSLNTEICARETRRFNEYATSLGEDAVILMISMDLPWTQEHWCSTARVEQVKVFSDHINADFGVKYGVLLEEPRILRRAIFVVNRDGVVRYADYMAALEDEPNYDEVIETAKELLSE